MERLFPDDFEKPVESNSIIRFFKISINYTKMQLGFSFDEHALRRIIFLSVRNDKGEPLKGRNLFSFGANRFPVFYVDINTESREVISIKDLKPRHKWGESPMPMF